MWNDRDSVNTIEKLSVEKADSPKQPATVNIVANATNQNAQDDLDDYGIELLWNEKARSGPPFWMY